MLAVGAAAAAVFQCANPVPAANTATNAVFGWGSHWRKQLGPMPKAGDTVTRPSPLSGVSSSSTPVYTKVAGGLMHTLVVEAAGHVFSCGQSINGELGTGPTAAKNTFMTSFDQVSRYVGGDNLPQVINFTLVDAAAGWYHSCVLSNDGRVFCTGKNFRGQLGNNFTSLNLIYLVDGPSAFQGSITALTAGPDHNAALDSTGNVWTWGNGLSGELGSGNRVVSKRAVQVAGLQKITSIGCGFRYCLALDNNGTLYGWGLNDQHQLSANTTAIYATPIVVATGVTSFAAGGSHVLTVINGRLYSHGLGTLGQTAQPLPADIAGGLQADWTVPAPALVASMANVAVYKIAAGMKHSVVLDTCGSVYTFGSAAMSQLGLENAVGQSQAFRSYTPRVVPGVAARNVLPLNVFAAAYNTYIIAVPKPSRR